jgi:hypothetical protein
MTQVATGGHNGDMRAISKSVPAAVLAVFSCGWVGASIRTDWRLSESRLVVPVEESSEEVMRASLRNDVAMHPGDFVAFPTETAAMRFMREHSTETSRETQPRMLDLGVMGYWQGRTLVVVPISPVEAR